MSADFGYTLGDLNRFDAAALLKQDGQAACAAVLDVYGEVSRFGYLGHAMYHQVRVSLYPDAHLMQYLLRGPCNGRAS
jgi:hypothetical protein